MTGATFAEPRWDAYNASAFAASFAGTVAMWWVYFATTAAPLSHAVGLVIVVASAALFWEGPPVALAAATSLALCIVGLWEALRRRRTHHATTKHAEAR